jgi:type II secretory pathway component PulF
MADLKKRKPVKDKPVLKEYEFIWTGKDKARRNATGTILALDEKIVRIELRKQGINVVSIKKKPQSLFSKRASKNHPC